MATTLASGSIDLKSLKVAGEPNKYITYIDSTNGIRVYDSKSNGNYVNFAQLNSNGLQIYKGGTATANKIAQFGEIHVPSNNPTVTIGEVAQDKYNLWMLPKGMFIRQGGALKHFLGDVGLYLNQYTSITPGRMKLATDNGLCFADLYSPNMKTVTQVRTFIIEEGTTESRFSLDARFQSFSINNAQFEIENPASGVTYTGQVQYATSAVAPPTQDWYYGTTYTATYAITPAISGPNSITITYETTVPAIKFVLGYKISDRIEIDDGAMKFFKAEDISNPIVNFNKEYIQIGSINEVHTTIDTQGLKIYDNQGSLRADYSDSVILYGGTSSNGAAPYININATNGITILSNSNNYATINTNGMNVYKNGLPVAYFGSYARIGFDEHNHVTINTDGLDYTTVFNTNNTYEQHSIFNVSGTRVNYEPGDIFHDMTNGTVSISVSSTLQQDDNPFGEDVIEHYYNFSFFDTDTDITVMAYRYYRLTSDGDLHKFPAVIHVVFNNINSDNFYGESPSTKLIVNNTEYTNGITLMRPVPFGCWEESNNIHLAFTINGLIWADGGSFIPTWSKIDELHIDDTLFFPETSTSITYDSSSVASGALTFSNNSTIKLASKEQFSRYSWDPNTTIGTRRTDAEGTGFTTTIGRGLTNSISDCLVVGKYNAVLNDDTLFAIGNGTGINNDYRNALKINTSGSMAMGYEGSNNSIQLNNKGAVAIGRTWTWSNTYIKATADGSLARGVAGSNTNTPPGNGIIQATEEGATAIGVARYGGTITASGIGAFAFGYAQGSSNSIIASFPGSFAGGSANYGNILSNKAGSLARGYCRYGNIKATAIGATAIGYASGYSSSNPSLIQADGNGAFACGTTNIGSARADIKATAGGAIAMGQYGVQALCEAAAAFNRGTIANADAQTTIGTFNIEDSFENTTRPSESYNYGAYAFIIGNGVDEDNRSNALTVDWNGKLGLNNDLLTIDNHTYNGLNNTYYSTDGYHAFYATTTSGTAPVGILYIEGDEVYSTKQLRIEGHSSKIGTVLSTSNSYNVSSSSTFANLNGVNLSVPAGSWVFTWSAYCDVNSDAKRLGGRLYNAKSGNEWNYSRTIAYTGGTAAIAISGAASVELTETSTIHLQVFQNSGATKAVSGYLRAIRIS